MECLSEKQKHKLSKFLSPKEFFNQKLSTQTKFNIQIKKNSTNFQPLILTARSSQQKIKNKSLPFYSRHLKKDKMHTSMNVKQQAKQEEQNKVGRRISSEQKIYKNQTQQNSKNQSKFSLTFAKKLLSNMKRQTSNTKFHERNLSGSRNLMSRSVSLNKSQQNKSKLKSSVQKLQPQFISKSIYPKVSKNRYKEDKAQKFNFVFKQSQRKLQAKKQKLQFVGYLQYINADTKDLYKVNQNLSQLNTINNHNFEEHFDEKACKLVQSLLLCVLDILSFSQMVNSDIIKEYASVFFTIHQKSVNQFILLDQVFKEAKIKLAKYFILLRLAFYSLFVISSEAKLEQTKYMSQVIRLFKDNEEVYSIILKILSQNNVDNCSGLIDTFKTLRLIRELEKKLPKIEETLKHIIHQNKKNQQIYAALQEFLQYSIQNHLLQYYQKLVAKQQFINWKYFRIPPVPFLPVSKRQHGYTLVIDLDGTLIYYNQQTKILKYRPFMDRFLNTMKKYFDLVCFSSFGKERSDLIIKQIEREDKIFAYRLYKSHMAFKNGNLLKDLSLIGRPLKKALILDDQQKNVQINPLNGIDIKPFYGDKKDKQLMHICDLISGIMDDKPQDLRGKFLKKYQSLQHIQQVQEGTITIQHENQDLMRQN